MECVFICLVTKDKQAFEILFHLGHNAHGQPTYTPI